MCLLRRLPCRSQGHMPHVLSGDRFIKRKETPTDTPWCFETTDGAMLGQWLSQNNLCAEVSTVNKSHQQSQHELCQASPLQQASKLAVVSFLFKIYFIIYLFILGCIGSQLRHAGSSLRHTGSFVAERRLLSSCGIRVFSLQLWCAGLVTLRYVGCQFPVQGSNLGPLHCKADSLPLDHQESPSSGVLTGDN